MATGWQRQFAASVRVNRELGKEKKPRRMRRYKATVENNEQAIAQHKAHMAKKGWGFSRAWNYVGVTDYVNLEYRRD